MLIVLQEIDSIEVSKDEVRNEDNDNDAGDSIDGIPLPAKSTDSAVTAVQQTHATDAVSSSCKVSAGVIMSSQQATNDAESDEEAEWKGVPPQGVQ